MTPETPNNPAPEPNPVDPDAPTTHLPRPGQAPAPTPAEAPVEDASEDELPTRASANDEERDEERGPDYRLDVPRARTERAEDQSQRGKLIARLREGGTLFEVELIRTRAQKQTFENEVIFDHCHLHRVNFKKSVFKQRVVFKNCVLVTCLFNGVVFEQGVRFEHCEFQRSRTGFHGITSQGSFVLKNCTFSDPLKINACVFAGVFDGWDSRFAGWVDFVGCSWGGNLDLRSAGFDEGLVFTQCTIEGDFLFRGATVQKKLSLDGITINGCLDLQKVKLNDFSYLQELTLGPKATLRLWNAIPRFLLIKPDQVEGRLASEQEGDFAVAAEEYGILKTNYDALNWLDEEDWAYYRFKQTRRHAAAKAGKGGALGPLTRLAETLVFDWGCGYGTMPMRVLATSMMVILLFTGICCIPLLTHGVPGYPDGDAVGPCLKTYRLTGSPGVDAVITAGIDSASAFVSGFDGVDKNVDGWLALALTLDGLSGMLLLGLFIVSFSRKVIR